MVTFTQTTEDLASTRFREFGLDILFGSLLVFCRLSSRRASGKEGRGRRRSRAYLVPGGQFQYDVLPYGRSSTIGALLVSLLLSKFRPFFPLGDGVLYNRFLERPFYLASDLYVDDQQLGDWYDGVVYFDFLALIVDGVLDRYPYAILVDVVVDGFCSELVYVVCPRRFLSGRHCRR